MTATVYALLVGIDRYRTVPALRGCGNDITAVHGFLSGRLAPGTALAARVLRDGDATREAVIDGFRHHLARAGRDDVALFWFCGHGSQAPVPPVLWHLEPTGALQTLVCADSRDGAVPDLLDKELSLLLDGVAASGCHTVAVIDSCHSGGATRGPAARCRALPPLAAAPAVDRLLPELLTPPGPEVPEHVALAACRSFESAEEMLLDGAQHGLFSWALLRALRRLGPAATYRELLAAARCDVERRSGRQVPQLGRPARDDDAGPAPATVDQPFLGGRTVTPASGTTMRYLQGEWEIDAGACHGLTGPDTAAGGEPAGRHRAGRDRTGETRVAVAGPGAVREARVVEVLGDRSRVEPLGWRPDPDRQYPVVVSRVPMPATTVAVDGCDPDTATRLLAAIRTAGPDGGPSPHLRPLAAADDTAEVPELRVATTGYGPAAPGRWPGPRGMGVPGGRSIVVLDADGAPLHDGVPLTDGPEAPRRAVAVLEHIARWRQVRALANPASSLAGAVTLEVVEARPGEAVAPLDRPPLRYDADGVLRLRYRRGPSGWIPPAVFVRLRNLGSRRLYCVLLDLTERFRIHASLFPGDHVAGGHAGAALRGRPVELRLPRGRYPEPGVTARDWFTLLVAEDEFASRPFEIPAVDRPMTAVARGSLAVHGLLDRLGLLAVHRDAGEVGGGTGGYDWSATTIQVVTEVPAPGEGPDR